MKCLRSLLVLTLLLPLSSLAQTVSAPTAFDRFMGLATGAGKTTVTLASDGTPLAAPGVPTITTDGGLPKATATGSVVNPAGNRVPVTATARVPAAEVAAAGGRLLGRLALRATAVIGVGLALYEFAKEMKYILSRGPDGSVVVQRENDQATCNVSHGATPYDSDTNIQKNWYCVPEMAGSASYRYGWSMTAPAYGWTGVSFPCGNYSCATGSLNYAMGTTSNVTVGEPLPSTMQEFLDAVAAKSGWPAGSKVGEMLEESALQTGVKIKTGPMTVTGPATSPGAQKVTQNSTNNTTTTENTTYNHTYNGDTINTTTVTVTNVTDNTTGQTISNETTTETPDKEEDPPEEEATDTPLPELPKLYTPKYPNGLEGVWTQQKAALNATPLATLAGRLMPAVGNSGTCPVMNIDLAFAVWADFGVKDVAPPCYVWDWARLIVLVGALLLARALIFGG